MLPTCDYIKLNKQSLYNSVRNLTINPKYSSFSPPEIYKSYCTDQSKSINFYTQNFDTYLLKQYDTVNSDVVTDDDLFRILSDRRILNVFYFEVWGSVIEHKDPKGRYLGYPHDEYQTTIMPIDIPTSDKSIFNTFYNKESVDLKEGEFFYWDVTKVAHSWHFDYSKVNKKFKLLHLDYIE
jgi:hypothetical protein